MSFLLNLKSVMLNNPTIWTSKITMDSQISLIGKGSSKILLQATMCVVNMKGLIESKTETSKAPIIVNKMMTAMVETIGPTLFLAKDENAKDNEATVHKAKNAMTKAKPNLQARSASGIINNPSEFSTIKSPLPNIHLATNKDRNPNQRVIINVYMVAANHLERTIPVREIGFVANIRIVPAASSPESKSPVTKEIKRGT